MFGPGVLIALPVSLPGSTHSPGLQKGRWQLRCTSWTHQQAVALDVEAARLAGSPIVANDLY